MEQNRPKQEKNTNHNQEQSRHHANSDMNTLSIIDVLGRKIDYFLNTFHNLREENDALKKKLISFDKEFLEKNKEIEKLKKENQAKEQELSEIIAKLEKILN